MFFEWGFGKTHCDLTALANKYFVDAKQVRTIIDDKLDIGLKARYLWPKYATMEEDEHFRNAHWTCYDGKNPVLWDNTGLHMYKPSEARMQRATYSKYYCENCCKGGIHCQFCGWQGANELWVGSISDTEYFTQTKILETQTKFMQEHDTLHRKRPFLNILDKGYRIVVPAWQSNHQLVLQPAFVDSDRIFGSKAVFHSSCVASDRSGNERGVRYSKMSHRVRNGPHCSADLRRFNNLWLMWNFQVNFMYKCVF